LETCVHVCSLPLSCKRIAFPTFMFLLFNIKFHILIIIIFCLIVVDEFES
jgi:hypothetical protein